MINAENGKRAKDHVDAEESKATVHGGY
jgi:hypothetical protein